MNKSELTNEISKALAAAQLEMKNPAFDGANPHFKSKFATLASVRNAVVPVLAKHGIAITQDLQTVNGGIGCTTTLLHESGQWLEFGPLVMPAGKGDAWSFGSAGTYAKRYSMSAVGAVVGDEDDDGSAASRNGSMKHAPADGLGVVDDRATALVDKMRETMATGEPAAVYAIHKGVRTDGALYIGASSLLKAKERAMWKEFIAAHEAANGRT